MAGDLGEGKRCYRLVLREREARYLKLIAWAGGGKQLE